MQAGDDHVLVVARIADDRGAVGAPRQVLEQAAALDLQLDVVAGVVQLLLGDGAGAVDRVEVERRRAEVARVLRVGGVRQPRARRRTSCRGRGTARRTSSPRCASGLLGLFALSEGSTISCFGPAESGSLASSRPPGFPSSINAASTPARLGERRKSEDPAEVIRPRICLPVVRGRGQRARRAQSHGARPCADSSQEPSATDSVSVAAHCCLLFAGPPAWLQDADSRWDLPR